LYEVHDQLERIGDLLLSFANSAQAAVALDPRTSRPHPHGHDPRKNVDRCGESFSKRDVKKAIDVLRADAEMDRLRNLISSATSRTPKTSRASQLQVIFMTSRLNARRSRQEPREEVCHFVMATVRHVLMSYDKPVEQMFIDGFARG